MNNKHKFLKRFLAFVLSAAMVITYMPMSMLAYAEEGDPAGSESVMILGTDVLAENVNTGDAQTVWYADKDWRVIGYDGQGDSAVNVSGAATLLTKGNIGLTHFSDNINYYAGSALKAKVETIAEDFSTEEKNAIVKKNLVHGQYSEDKTDCIAGNADIENVYLWPLSTKEAVTVHEEIRKLDLDNTEWSMYYWWLRSPGHIYYDAAVVDGNGSVQWGGATVWREEIGARPAFDLNLESVLFTSAAEGGKSSGTVGEDALEAQSDQNGSGGEWKVTLKSGHTDFSITESTAVNGSITVDYTGAAVGENEYISAVITDKPVTDSSAKITYYGRVQNCSSDSGTATINFDGKLGENDHLYVFNEQYNGDKKTDYAGELIEVPAIGATVTFKVVNGTWDDGTRGDKTVSMKCFAGETLKLAESDIPAVGTKPGNKFKAGSWDVTPDPDTVITEDTTYTYTYAAETPAPDMNAGSVVLSTDVNTGAAQTLWYADKAWRVIGYGGDGVASESGSATLLSSGTLGRGYYNGGSASGNVYSGSGLEGMVNAVKDSFSTEEMGAIISRTLEDVAGPAVDNARLWPLSKDEAEALDVDLRKVDPDHPDWRTSYWWLRSPGDGSNNACFVSGRGEIGDRGAVGESDNGVRPAFNLNLDHVLLTSAAVCGKPSGAEGEDALKSQSGSNSTGQWKVTLRSGHENFKIAESKATANSVTVKYTGATAGTEEAPEYISAVITDKPVTDSSAKITYYGRIQECTAESGTVTINFADKLGNNDHLYIFNEQYNGDKKTDYASELLEVSIPRPDNKPEPGNDPDQKGSDGTPVGPGASEASADIAITGDATDEGPAGTRYAPLRLQSKKQAKTSINLTWANLNGAAEYVVYGALSGKSNRMTRLASIGTNTMTVKDIGGVKLKKGKYYKFIVVALDSNKTVISTSKVAHVATKGGKVGNHKKVTVKKSAVSKAKKLKAGKTLKLKAKAVKAGKKVKKRRAVSYESTDPGIATVSRKGVVKGVQKGTCYIYAYAQNGVSKKIKVVVR